MKHASNLNKTESQFLLVLGTFVVLVGVPAILSFLKVPDTQALVVQKIESRTPASESIADEESGFTTRVIEKEKASTSLIQYDCEHKNLSEEVHGNYVRISGKPCSNFDDLEITNQTNGFSAAVIFTKGNRFTTDFIDLKEGENNLEIVATLDDGSKSSKIFTVVRRAPSSAKN